MKSAYRFISVEEAAFLLSRNASNRAVRKEHVRALARAIKENRFQSTHQGIALNSAGELIDGQHRMLAILEAQKGVGLFVTTDVGTGAYKAIDQGIRKRTMDVFGVSAKLSAVANMAHRLVTGCKPEPDTVEPFLRVLGPAHEAMLLSSGTAAKVLSCSAVQLGGIVAHLQGAPLDYVTTLYADLVNVRIEAMPPVAQSFVRQVVANTLHSNYKSTQHYVILVKAFKMFSPSERGTSKLLFKDIDPPLATIRNVLIAAVARP